MFPEERITQTVRRASLAIRRLRIRILEGPDEGAEHLVEESGAIVLGTSEDDTIALQDPTISRYHVEVAATDEGLHVRDLGSRNGTFLGDVRVVEAVVPPGSKLRLGETVVSLEDVGLAEAARPQLEPVPEVPGIIAESPAMQEVAARIHQLAPTQVSVLLQGETGVGKEVVARALHDLSTRREHPFVVVDCASMAPTLVASELFGHERGAFTGADQQRIGAFERAHGGTVFLDEVGELPRDLQPALLGVLERRRFRRVGGERSIEVDVRVLSASNRDLRAEANTGTFRPDLYFRLAVARIVVPPLRERPEDIEPLVREFARQVTGEPKRVFDDPTLRTFESHPWSGNVRELKNAVESALATGRVELGGPAMSTPAPPPPEPAVQLPRLPYREARHAAVERFEQEYLSALISECEGNASEAARRAQMDRGYLLSLLRKHGLR